MPNPFFSGRIPQSLYEKVEEHIKEHDKSKTELLVEALSQYLNHPIEHKKSIDNKEVWNAIEQLQEKVSELEERYKITTVINNDNTESNSEITQLPAPNEIKESNIQEDNKQKLKGKILKTSEVPYLPGLDINKATEIKTLLRNSKAHGKESVRVENYLLKISGKESGAKGSLLWEIVDDNIDYQNVITTNDNPTLELPYNN